MLDQLIMNKIISLRKNKNNSGFIIPLPDPTFFLFDPYSNTPSLMFEKKNIYLKEDRNIIGEYSDLNAYFYLIYFLKNSKELVFNIFLLKTIKSVD
ncbi:hypothetical protein BpHYR1_017286 [Brachionus plicatilis]|uniref:Uncharacterized protein n=1 Tax=Brachionus plicatilis TaxID=10195 RepID=A0A3M7P9U3_BRAPC|nr:hypothetical protein BpHYR1_017286 [Brachionus plicatilis]